MNRLNGIENARKNLPHYDALAAILENTNTRMQHDPIADTAWAAREMCILQMGALQLFHNLIYTYELGHNSLI